MQKFSKNSQKNFFMITFSNAKINIGLNIVEKCADGFHRIETIFYPIFWQDILECIDFDEVTFSQTGIKIDCETEKISCVKAYKLLSQNFSLKPLKIHLHKNVPFGAGLGAGSANGSFMLMLLNNFFHLGLTSWQLKSYAEKLGSDCAFFIENKPQFATERGNVFEKIDLDLEKYFISVVFPNFSISTAFAYSVVKPCESTTSLKELIKKPVFEWKNFIKNDFEIPIFAKYPILQKIKEQFYQNGAIYSAMSGSGSAIFGIFENFVDLQKIFPDFLIWNNKKN